MRFFDSEIVQEELKEITRLQQEVYSKVFAFSHMGKKEKLEHIGMLESLLRKQQVLYTRLSLSDDPEAKVMKEEICKAASAMGLPPNVDMRILFKNMTDMVGAMRRQIDNTLS